jgi:hypothetical protein
MLASPVSPPSPAADVHETAARRSHRLLGQLQAVAAPLLEQMAQALAEAPDQELFRATEARLRDLGQQLAAAAHQAGLDDRKKGATEVPAPSAPVAARTPATSTTGPTMSSPSTAP